MHRLGIEFNWIQLKLKSNSKENIFCFFVFFFELQVRDFLKRFETIPDLLELDHLTVSGDVTFGRKVSLKVNTRFKTKNFNLFLNDWLIN